MYYIKLYSHGGKHHDFSELLVVYSVSIFSYIFLLAKEQLQIIQFSFIVYEHWNID